MSEQKGFWTSLPGILTGLAAVITASASLYVTVFKQEVNNNTKPNDNTVISDPPSNGGNGTGNHIDKNYTNNEHIKNLTELTDADYAKFAKTGPLLECEHFPSVNTVASLMSWSNHYHQAIIEQKQYSSEEACNKAIGYRGQAHCLEPDNAEIRQHLLETLALCRKLGFEWYQVKL